MASNTGKGPVLFTGPDGICDYKAVVLTPATYVGIGTMSPEGTSELSYLWRAAQGTKYPSTRRVGQIGWKVHECIDNDGKQWQNKLHRGELRQLAEDRHANLYQNPWPPKMK